MGRDENHLGTAPHAEATRKPTLILGIGNILMSDDAIGVRVVEAMQAVPLPESVELMDGGTAGVGLVEAIANRSRLIVIDAMDAGKPPGTIGRFRPDELAHAGGLSSHSAGILDALHEARLLGVAPADVVVLGIQPVHLGPGLGLSGPLAAAVPAIIEQVLVELREGNRTPDPLAVRPEGCHNSRVSWL